MKRALAVLVLLLALLVGAEIWLRLSGAVDEPPARVTPPSLMSLELERARDAPLLVVGGSFTNAPDLEVRQRWPACLAQHVVGRRGFSEVLVAAPFVQPAGFVKSSLEQLARTAGHGAERSLNIVPHDRGPDVLVIEIGGDALGGDPRPFEIEGGRPFLPRESSDEGLALARLISRWARSRELAARDEALTNLIATDGFVAGAASRARHRLDLLTPAVHERRPSPDQVRFLRALILELHGLSRTEERNRLLAEWRVVLGMLRFQQRATVLVRTGPAMLTLGLARLAADLGVPCVHAPPFELDPRFRSEPPGRGAVPAVHAQVADSVWVELSRRRILPESLRAPASLSASADAIEAALRARGGIDEGFVTLAHTWLTERCNFEEELPPQALFGFGPRGRLVAGVPAEVVLTRPPLAAEVVVRGTARSGASTRLKLRSAKDDRFVEPLVKGTTRGDASREVLEFRMAAPPPIEIKSWPAFELVVVTEKGAPDPELEIASIEFTQQQ